MPKNKGSKVTSTKKKKKKTRGRSASSASSTLPRGGAGRRGEVDERAPGAGAECGLRSSPVDEGPAGRGRSGAACARGRRRGNAEARGGEVDEGAPGAGAETRSGGGGRRARACGQDRVRSLGGDRGARASGSRTPAAGFWPLGYMGWAEK